MTVWLVFIIGGALTYLERASFIAFTGDRRLPVPVERALRYVAPAVFAAIVFPALAGDDGFPALVEPSAEVIAAVVAAVFIWRVRSVPMMLVVGMVTLWLLQWAGL